MGKKKVIVAGATGSLGRKIVKELLAQGAEITALVRATSNTSKLIEMGVNHFVVGDMMDKESLRNALTQEYRFDAIVASAAGYTGHTKGDSDKTDRIGYQNLIDASKEAGIVRFVLISILESDKAVNVSHFYNKYLIEKYLIEKKQPFIALRPGAFLDQTPDFILPKIEKGILPVLFVGVNYGTIYTRDLARYAAMAAVSLPDSELNTTIDVGLSTPVNSDSLAKAFETVLERPVRPKPAVPSFVINVIAPIVGKFSSKIHDMLGMVKWVNTGAYVSKNTEKQRRLFGDLPTIEDAVRRYAKDNNLIP
jgi:uncharacterized protein YbjT (DUF2867 family)